MKNTTKNVGSFAIAKLQDKRLRLLVIIAILTLTVCSFIWGGGVEEIGGGDRDRRIFGGSGSALDRAMESANSEPKTLTITGMRGRRGRVLCYLIDNEKNEEVVVAVVDSIERTIANGAVTFPLMEYNTNMTTPWTGSGSYCIQLAFDWDGSFFFYTDGKTWAQLGISNVYEDMGKLPMYNFRSASTTIDFSKFREQFELYN